MSDGFHECERCHRVYHLDDGKEPTPHCHQCAHEVIAELTEKVAQLEGVLRERQFKTSGALPLLIEEVGEELLLVNQGRGFVVLAFSSGKRYQIYACAKVEPDYSADCWIAVECESP